MKFSMFMLAVALIQSAHCYPSHELKCKSCEPGYYVTKQCTIDSETSCLPCEQGTYTDQPNQHSCRQCIECPEGTLPVKHCSATTNTLCVSLRVKREEESSINTINDEETVEDEATTGKEENSDTVSQDGNIGADDSERKNVLEGAEMEGNEVTDGAEDDNGTEGDDTTRAGETEEHDVTEDVETEVTSDDNVEDDNDNDDVTSSTDFYTGTPASVSPGGAVTEVSVVEENVAKEEPTDVEGEVADTEANEANEHLPTVTSAIETSNAVDNNGIEDEEKKDETPLAVVEPENEFAPIEETTEQPMSPETAPLPSVMTTTTPVENDYVKDDTFGDEGILQSVTTVKEKQEVTTEATKELDGMIAGGDETTIQEPDVVFTTERTPTTTQPFDDMVDTTEEIVVFDAVRELPGDEAVPINDAIEELTITTEVPGTTATDKEATPMDDSIKEVTTNIPKTTVVDNDVFVDKADDDHETSPAPTESVSENYDKTTSNVLTTTLASNVQTAIGDITTAKVEDTTSNDTDILLVAAKISDDSGDDGVVEATTPDMMTTKELETTSSDNVLLVAKPPLMPGPNNDALLPPPPPMPEKDDDKRDNKDETTVEVEVVTTGDSMVTTTTKIPTLEELEANDPQIEDGSGDSDDKFNSHNDDNHDAHDDHDHDGDDDEDGHHTGASHHGDSHEDDENKKVTAIIVGVAVGGVALFTLAFFTSRHCKKKRQLDVEQDKKSRNGGTVELAPLTASHPGIYDDMEHRNPNGLYRHGPKMGPPSPRTYRKNEGKFQFPEVHTDGRRISLEVPGQHQKTESAQSLIDLLLRDCADKIKYIDESTDDEQESSSPRDRLLPDNNQSENVNPSTKSTGDQGDGAKASSRDDPIA